MPRSRLDPYKRKAAQALNHLAEAVIDVNDIYTAFDESIDRMRQADADNATNTNAEAIKKYQEHKEALKQIMMYVIVPRNELVKFIGIAWELDEESIKTYLG